MGKRPHLELKNQNGMMQGEEAAPQTQIRMAIAPQTQIRMALGWLLHLKLKSEWHSAGFCTSN